MLALIPYLELQLGLVNSVWYYKNSTPTSCQNKGNRKLQKEKSRLGREQQEGRSWSHVASVTVTIPFIINQQNAVQLQKKKTNEMSRQ